MRGPRKNRFRTESPIPIDLQNNLARTTNDQPRTNNYIEKFHKALHSVTNTCPTIRRLIECLRNSEAIASKRQVDVRLGGYDRKKKFRSGNEKLGKIIEGYELIEKKIFLKDIAACIPTF